MGIKRDYPSEYKTWENMKQRCNNPNLASYVNYGGRGIKYCKRWEKFIHFLEDMGPKPARGYTIERINNNGNYSKRNCKWIKRSDQSRNKSNVPKFTYKGESKTLAEWAELYGFIHGALITRIYRKGMTLEQALTTPCRYKKSEDRRLKALKEGIKICPTCKKKL